MSNRPQSPDSGESTHSEDPIGSLFQGITERLGALKGNDRAAYEDLEFFSRYVIGHEDQQYVSNSRFLKSIYEDLQHTNDDLLVLGPRGSAKSQAVTITYTAWAIGRNPLLRVVLAFASLEAQGLAFGRQLKHIITQNERYIRIFGNLKPAHPEKWSDTEFIVRRHTPGGGLKDPTVGIVGIGSAVPSKRADVIICDDLVTMQNAYSEAMRTQVKRFVFQTLFPILTPSGRRVIVGSRWDPRDLYSHTAQVWNLDLPKVPPLDLRNAQLPQGIVETPDDLQNLGIGKEREQWDQREQREGEGDHGTIGPDGGVSPSNTGETSDGIHSAAGRMGVGLQESAQSIHTLRPSGTSGTRPGYSSDS